MSDDEIRKIEIEWRKERLRPSASELRETFEDSFSDLEKKYDALDDEIIDKERRCSMKWEMLKYGVLSLQPLDPEEIDPDDPNALLFFRPGEWRGLAFGELVVENVFEPRIEELEKEQRRISSILDPPEQHSDRRGKRFSEEEIGRARDAPLADVAGEYVEGLKRVGNRWQGRCPFHHPDTHPSFSVYREKNRFICFACGAKGDVIAFLMKVENINFYEAVEALLYFISENA